MSIVVCTICIYKIKVATMTTLGIIPVNLPGDTVVQRAIIRRTADWLKIAQA